MYKRQPVAEPDATRTAEDKSVAINLSPALKFAEVLRVEEAAAFAPPPPVIATVGADVYPDPAAVTLIPIIV